MDTSFIGYKYTWTKNRKGDVNVQERLDRYLITQNLKLLYMNEVVRHLARLALNHAPFLILGTKVSNRRVHRFMPLDLRRCNFIVMNVRISFGKLKIQGVRSKLIMWWITSWREVENLFVHGIALHLGMLTVSWGRKESCCRIFKLQLFLPITFCMLVIWRIR